MSEEFLVVEYADDWRAVCDRLGGMEGGNVRRFRFENSDDLDPKERALVVGPHEGRELVIEVQAQFTEFEWAELRFFGVQALTFCAEWDAIMEWRAEHAGWHVNFLSVQVLADRCVVTIH